MSGLRDNVAPLTGMAAFAAAFLAVYAATTSLVDSLLVAAPLAVGIALIVLPLFPSNPDLQAYNLDARRRVKGVLGSVARITKLAQDVADPKAKQSILNACSIIPQLLRQTQQQQTTSFKVASTAANVQNY